ncbi:hypothetical protein ACU4GD_41520 [Cupriavidus basilensis]
MAELCADWKLDAMPSMRRVLHDVMEDQGITKSAAGGKILVPRVSELVDGLTKLDKLEFQSREQGAGREFPQDAAGDAARRRAGDPGQAGRPARTNMRTLDFVAAGKAAPDRARNDGDLRRADRLLSALVLNHHSTANVQSLSPFSVRALAVPLCLFFFSKLAHSAAAGNGRERAGAPAHPQICGRRRWGMPARLARLLGARRRTLCAHPPQARTTKVAASASSQG